VDKLLPVIIERPPSSRVFLDLLQQAPAESFTLAWLSRALNERSFGVLLVCLGLFATIPIGSTIPGLMLLALSVQMIAGRGEPLFPRFIANRPLPTRHLVRVGRRAVPVLLFLERAVHPRWPRAFDAMRHGMGLLVLLLSAVLLLTPVPLSNVAPAVIISLASLAYVEEDGLLLTLAVVAGIAYLLLISAAIWGAVLGLIFISHV
jgi:hypothetical protein